MHLWATYNTTKLQRAAVLHEKTLRPPWQSRKGLLPATGSDGKGSKGVRATYLTGIEDDEEHEELPHEDDEGIPEEEAAEIHEAYVAQETAKARFREVAKARGVDPALLRDPKKTSLDDTLKTTVEQRLQAAKARSYCAGHWHKDPERRLNQNKSNTDSAAQGHTIRPRLKTLGLSMWLMRLVSPGVRSC